LNYGTTGTGSTQHLATELLTAMTGAKLHHVPYKGGGQVITALLVGEADLAFTSPSNAREHVKAGRLKPIAVSGGKRVPALPQVPTFTEAGLPNFDVANWYGIFAPAGTPREIIDKLSAELEKILAMPDVKKLLVAQGVEPFYSTPEQFAARIKADIARYGKVIKQANIKLEES
jgi:tripartite-type tricarboxylate transporter receptor subunit TctC